MADVDYKVALDIYNGPLDLLLYLIKKNEVDIFDIPICEITEQYLEYLNLFEKLDINYRERVAKVFSEYKPDAVLHLAAESHVDRSIKDSTVFIRTNIS